MSLHSVTTPPPRHYPIILSYIRVAKCACAIESKQFWAFKKTGLRTNGWTLMDRLMNGWTDRPTNEWTIFWGCEVASVNQSQHEVWKKVESFLPAFTWLYLWLMWVNISNWRGLVGLDASHLIAIDPKHHLRSGSSPVNAHHFFNASFFLNAYFFKKLPFCLPCDTKEALKAIQNIGIDNKSYFYEKNWCIGKIFFLMKSHFSQKIHFSAHVKYP